MEEILTKIAGAVITALAAGQIVLVANGIDHPAPAGVTNTPEPTPTATRVVQETPDPTAPVYPSNRALSSSEMRSLLAETGWPEGLIEEALIVAWKESGYRPYIVNGIGCCYGLFQIHARTWASHCGLTPRQLLQPRANARCALEVYRYDVRRGLPRWNQWEAKPW